MTSRFKFYRFSGHFQGHFCLYVYINWMKRGPNVVWEELLYYWIIGQGCFLLCSFSCLPICLSIKWILNINSQRISSLIILINRMGQVNGCTDTHKHMSNFQACNKNTRTMKKYFFTCVLDPFWIRNDECLGFIKDL